MKHLLLQSLACLAFLFPFAQAEATTYGGFKPGKTFSLTVTTRSSIKLSFTGINSHAAVPSDFPDFAKGKVVKFTIDNKGQLTAKNMSIPLLLSDSLANVYGSQKKTSALYITSSGQLVKTKSGRVTKVVLSFMKTTSTTSQNVDYVLE